MPPYRTKLGHKIHQCLLKFLRNQNRENLSAFQAAVANADEAALIAQSIHGDSHVVDIFHLGSEFQLTADAIKALLTTLMRVSDKFPLSKKILLLAANQNGFTPLHHALISGNSGYLRVYLDEVRQAVQNGTISPKEHRSLLLHVTQAWFTPLHQALIANNPENTRVYFAELKQAMPGGEYKTLLLHVNRAGFTTLHQALISGNPENLRVYCEEVSQAMLDGPISNAAYKALLMDANRAGFDPLHQALKSGNVACIQEYFDLLRNAYAANIFSMDEYRGYICQLNRAGFSPLHRIANNAQHDLAAVQLFIKILEKNFDTQHIARMLHDSTPGFIPHCDPKSPNASTINAYLDELRASKYSLELPAQTFRESYSYTQPINFFLSANRMLLVAPLPPRLEQQQHHHRI